MYRNCVYVWPLLFITALLTVLGVVKGLLYMPLHLMIGEHVVLVLSVSMSVHKPCPLIFDLYKVQY